MCLVAGYTLRDGKEGMSIFLVTEQVLENHIKWRDHLNRQTNDDIVKKALQYTMRVKK